MPRKNTRALNIFGSKVQKAYHYPAPTHKTIIEPFAGGAGYSLLHSEHDVILYDVDTNITGAWDYLINASQVDIMSIPLIVSGQDVASLKCSEGAKLVVSWCLNQTGKPNKRLSSWGEYHNARGAACYWSAARRLQMAEISSRIKHWKVITASWESVPDIKATWFIDPPYVGSKSYTFNSVDYQQLADWCKARKGQTIACERSGATWLPFKPLYVGVTQRRFGASSKKTCSEVMWYNAI